MEELKQEMEVDNEANNASENIPRSQSRGISIHSMDVKCPDHPHEYMDSFCKTCDQPICSKCYKESHHKHKWITKSDYVERLNSKMPDLEASKQRIAELSENCTQRIGEVQETKTKVTEEFRYALAQLRRDLDKCEQLLEDTVQGLTETQTSALERCKMNADELVEKFGDISQRTSVEEESIMHYKMLVSESAKYLKTGGNISGSVPEDLRIHVTFNRAAIKTVSQNLLQQLSKSVLLSEPATVEDIYVSGFGARSGIQGKESKFEVCSKDGDMDSNPKTFTEDVTCSLSHKTKDVTVECDCKQQAANKWLVTYTADQTGDFALNIKLGTKPVFSTLPVVTIVPPLEKYKFASKKTVPHLLKGLRGPTGVTVNNKGILIICERTAEVVTRKEYGVHRKFYGEQGTENGEFITPTDVAFTADFTHFLVADTGNNRLQKWDTRGKFVTAVGQEGSGKLEFDTPTAIAVDSKDHVYVVEHGNNRVQVLSQDFLHERFIYCPASAKFTCIATGAEDMVFVGCRKHGLHKFDSQGQCLLTFSSPDQISPSCICVSALGFVYVGDDRSNSVLVFTSDGEFLHQMDNSSDSVNPKQFGKPKGIAVDNSNNLYISDPENGRLIVLKLEGQ